MRNFILAALLAGASVAAHADSGQSELRGQYDLKDGSRLTITEHRHTLYAQLGDGPVIALAATGPATFTGSAGRLRIEFKQAANGSVSGLYLTREESVASNSDKRTPQSR